MTRLHLSRLAPLWVALFLALAPCLTAQETERPVTFDAAGRISTLSPSVVTRLGLAMPQWPVVGDYVDARLYEQQGGGFVIVVQKADGSFNRYPISAEARRQLADIIGRAMLTTGLATSAERLDVISEPAGSRFVINQLAAGLLIYGPAAAAAGDGGGAAFAYLLTAGSTFFIASAVANKGTVTKAQNSLATDGIWRGALLANGIRYAIVGDDEVEDPTGAPRIEERDRVTPVVTLAGALAGTIIGFNIGRNLTDGEAGGAAMGSTVLAATTAGAIGIGSAWSDGENRGQVGALVGASLIGYPLGLRYARRSAYRVTAGDVSTVLTTGLVGALAAGALIPDDPSQSLASGLLTGGFLAGLAIGDRMIAKPYDLTESDAFFVRVGTLAGALIGFAIPAALETDNSQVVIGFGSLGAVVGTAATTAMVRGRKH
jgi:hypothetical protein